MRDPFYKKLHSTVRPLLGGFAAFLVCLSLFSPNAFSRVIDGIAIIVNEDAILVSQINEMMMPLLQDYRSRFAGAELKQKMNDLRETIIEQAIDTKLILQVARNRGLTADEKAINERVEVVKKRFPSETEFLETLAGRGITYREYYDQVAEQVLVQDTLRRVLGVGISVTDNEIEEYYETHKEEFVTEPKVKLAQIFLGVPSGSTPEQIDEIRQKAEQLRVLAEDGINFSELATKYSEGPYRDKGGIIGLAGPREILPDLEETAFSLETNETSPILQTTYGFHILKALEAFPSRKIEFDEARPNIDEHLHEMKRNEKYKDWMKKLREDSFIEVKI